MNSEVSHAEEDLPSLDLARLAELRQVRNGSLLASLARGYREQGLREVLAIRAAVEQGQMQEGARLAHSLKSSSMSIGALVVCLIARRLEDQMRDGRDEELLQLCGELESNFGKTVAELQDMVA